MQLQSPGRSWTRLPNAAGAWIRRLTVQQWRAMEAEWTPKEPPSERLRLQVLGLYLVFAVVLLLSNYVSSNKHAFHAALPMLTGHADELFLRRLWWAWTNVGLYTLVPLAYARFVLGMSLRDVGLRFDGLRRHAWIYLGALAIVLPMVWLASATPAFQKVYPFVPDAGRDWQTLLLWELSYAAQFVALEVFFRGVMVLGPARVLGPWAIPAMAIPYMAIHFRKPFPEALGSLFAGTLLGGLALRTGSVAAGVIVHVVVAWSMDGCVLWRQGSLQRLLGLD